MLQGFGMWMLVLGFCAAVWLAAILLAIAAANALT